MKHLTTLLACLIAAVMIYITACNLVPAIAPVDWPEPPAPIVDTCDNPQQVTDPPFVVGYMEITETLLTDPVYIVGDTSFVLLQDEIDSLEVYLDRCFESQFPAYDFTVYASDSDYRRVAVIVDGTNDRHQFYLAAQVRYNGLKHYFGWTTQYFTFGGALTAAEFGDIASQYPSVDHFNFRATEYDSTEYDHIARIILGECKAGRYWANFNWGGPWDPDLIAAFEEAGWQIVTH